MKTPPAKTTSMPSADEKAVNSDGADSDGSMSWEEFFGTTTAEDLVPTLLTMYDALVGRPRCRPHLPPPPPPPRPLSVTSIASSSSSSSSSVTSSSSGAGRRLVKGSAYLASIESLDDSEDEAARRTNSRSLGESGVCSPCSFISSPSPPHTKPKYCDPNLSYMDRVVMEIIETEGVYVNDLGQVIIGYLERWDGNPESPLTEVQLQHLFSNLQEIYNFNSAFLRELEKCGLDPVKVAKAFVRNNSGFSIYTEYCTNYPRTVGVLTELMRQESSARVFRERQASLQHTLPLGSYLLKPVQRILKYHLLLQNIVKNLEAEAEGYGSVVDALSTMTAIAHHINEMKRKHEHAVRVQEIQSLLLNWQGEDLTTFGELCAEGTFRMAGAKALRHAFLFDQMLLITKKKEEGILGYKAHIMCSNLMLIESVPGEPLSFHVIPFDNPRHQYTLQARNMEQKREWTLQLKRVILENYNAVIPSHARQLVMQLGQSRCEDELVVEKGTPKKQHSAPEYLERRKQERRKSETGLRARLRPRPPRKSDSSIASCIKAQQRFRRNNQYPSEDSAVLSTDSNTEQCGSPRRKSEPGCFSENELENDLRSELHISEQSLSNENEVEEKKSVEEIVSQLLMQNKEFQRVLKKQMTRRGVRVSETSDEEGDYDNLRGVWPTSPEVWLKRQREHMPGGGGKAGSLPRGFPRPPPTRPSPDRPFTIASDKPRELEDMEHFEGRFQGDETTTEEETTPHASTHNLEIHPEYRIYRPSLTRAGLRQVVASVGGKLAGLRLSSEAIDKQLEIMPVYKQGSSGLGARIAHTSTSDYADPRTLFQTQPPRKAASLLGLLRPPSLHSSSSGYSSKRQAGGEEESDDGFYEKSFEAIETVAVSCRDSAVFSDSEDSHPSLSARVPPPVPQKPTKLMTPPKSPDDECDSSSVASTVIEAQTTKGWVKHVICKIQGEMSSH